MRCMDCGVMVYKNDFFFDFKENFDYNKSLKIYLEKTSDLEGLVSIIYNLLSEFSEELHRGLDIGCGVGILMDFSQSIMQKPMVGFEPSIQFSNEGRRTLKLNIIQDFFSPNHTDVGEIDFAVCFQVLQMTPNPSLLLKQIKASLPHDSIFLLSTPSNSSIHSGINIAENISVLSPGVHRTLFNEKSLKYILETSGFQNVMIYETEGQLFAVSSTKYAQRISGLNLFKRNRDVILDYYQKRMATLKEDTSYYKGIWCRLYRNRIDNGEYEQAFELLKKTDWFEVWSEDEIKSIESQDKFLELNSSADAIIYYYTGILMLNHLHRHDYAEQFFSLSFLLCKKIIEKQPEMCAIEKDILWLAKLHSLIAKKYQGRLLDVKMEITDILTFDSSLESVLPNPSSYILQKIQQLESELK